MKTLSILKQRNYQLYFSGQVVSLTGSWVQNVAITWLVYEWTKSSTWVGAFTFASQIPSFLVSSIAGVLSDRTSRRKLFMASQWAGAIQALAMSLAFISGSKSLPLYMALTVILGCITGFELTARFGLVVDLGKRQDWSSAISLNSAMVQGTRMLGPAIAGILLYNGQALACFLFNVISYGPVIYALSKTVVDEKPKKVAQGESFFEAFGHSIQYAWSHIKIRRILAVAVLLSAVGAAMNVLLPEISSVRLSGDARTFSWLTSASALGAATGSLYVALWDGPKMGLRSLTLRILAGLGTILTIFAFSKSFAVALASIAVFGFFSMQLWPTLNHAIQSTTDEAFRGRVTALWNMTFMGMTPLASLLIGWASDHSSPELVLLVSGTGTFLFVIGIFLAPSLSKPARP
ncbi:MAG: MFS transporter [Bdellovibrionales bacterium]|nr:MFS transporter [Bdellovibrionales bacterium]